MKSLLDFMGYEARTKFRKNVYHLIELFESRRNEVAKQSHGGPNVICQSSVHWRSHELPFAQ